MGVVPAQKNNNTIQRAALLDGIPSDPKVVQPLLYYIDLREKLYADSTVPSYGELEMAHLSSATPKELM